MKTKREQRRVGHVYHEIAQQLEAFAKRCDTYIDDIDEQLDLFYQRDDNAFRNFADFGDGDQPFR